MPEPLVYISVGSNVEPEANLRAALKQLAALGDLVCVSSVYQSPPFGFTDQPDFLDVVVALRTAYTPAAFKEALGIIEKNLGRDRALQTNKYGPLTLDMDILLWGEQSFSYGHKPWTVPDKSILKYAAVAIPLAEIAPDLVHPIEGVTLKEIAARFDDGAGIRITGLTL